jgi:hypothetical protein
MATIRCVDIVELGAYAIDSFSEALSSSQKFQAGLRVAGASGGGEGVARVIFVSSHREELNNL